jgi:hypothetical protein
VNAPAARDAKRAYPGKVAIRHVIEAARACGVDVAGVEVSPDGTIRVVEARTLPERPKDEFEAWEAQGKL